MIYIPNALIPIRTLASASLLLIAPYAYSAWVVNPSVEVTAGYDDNVRLTADNEENAITSSATAQASLRNVTERSEVSGVAGISYLVYSGAEDLDNEDAQFLKLNASRSAERTEFGIRISGQRDLILRQANPIDDLLDGAAGDATTVDQDAGALPDGNDLEDPLEGSDIDLNVIREQARRTRVNVAPYLAYQLSERNRASLGLIFSKREFDSDGEQLGLRDTQTMGADVSLRRTFTPRTAAILSAGISRFESDQGFDSDSYKVGIGWEQQLTMQTRIAVKVGAGRHKNQLDGEDTRFAYGIRVSRDTEVGRLSVAAERSVVPSPFGGIVDADRLNLRYQHMLSPTLEFSLDAYGYRVQRLGATIPDDQDYFAVQPRLTWRIGPSWSIGAFYRYRWTDRDQDQSSAQSNAVSLALSYQPPSRI